VSNPRIWNNFQGQDRKVLSKGTLFVMSAPSGAGKTTLVRQMAVLEENILLSVSYTTRPARHGEKHGKDYHFVDLATFKSMQDQGEFAESAEVHGNFYGTSRKWLENNLQRSRDIILEIDWQGASEMRKMFPNLVSIFIMPPSREELERRLRTRGQDSNTTVARRLDAAWGEIQHANEFDFVIINHDLRESIKDCLAVLRASRLRFVVQQQHLAGWFANPLSN